MTPTPQEAINFATQVESLGIVGILILLLVLAFFIIAFLVRHYVKHYKELSQKYETCQQRVRQLELAIADLAASVDVEEVRRKAHNIVESLSR